MSGVFTAAVETAPSPYSGDSVDDAAVWIHPTEPEQSVVLATLKASNQKPVKPTGILTYDLQGNRLQFLEGGTPNNIDVRRHFPFNGGPGTLIATSHWYTDEVGLYQMDTKTRRLKSLSQIKTSVTNLRGLCMANYDGSFYVFAVGSSGIIEQHLITSELSLQLVNRWQLASESEGCVVDDKNRRLFVTEENTAIWSIDLADQISEPQVFDKVSFFGPLAKGLEGASLITVDKATYLVVSVQEKSRFAVYNTETNEHIGNFKITNTDEIDAVSKTDGIDISNLRSNLFPEGLIVVHDDNNTDVSNQTEHQNFKLVSSQQLIKFIRTKTAKHKL